MTLDIDAFKRDWDNPLLTVAEIAAKHGIKPKATEDRHFRQRLGLRNRKAGPKFGKKAYCKARPVSYSHELVKEIYQIAADRRISLRDITEASGINGHTICDWQWRSPRMDTFTQALQPLGKKLAIVDIA